MRRRSRTSGGLRAVALLLPPALATTLLPLPAEAAPPPVWTHNSADRLFPGTTRPANAPAGIQLSAARNEVEAAQIAVRPTTTTQNVRVTTTPLTGPGGATIDDITVRRQYLHPNVTRAEGWGQVAETEPAPSGSQTHYYDALVENTPQTVNANVTLPYHYSVRVPAGQPAGTYTGSATVESSTGNAVVPVTLTVYPVTLPPTDESTFKVNNWTTSAGWDYTGTIKAIPAQYANAQLFSPNWWTVVENMARNHGKHRNNVVYADFQALSVPDSRIDALGNIVWDWTNFDRFVGLYEKYDAAQWIYTPTLLIQSNPSQVEALQRIPGTDRVEMRPLQSGTDAATAYVDKMFAALKRHLDEKGWTDKFFMSANDETSERRDTDAANWLYALYRRHFPNPLLNEAENHLMDPAATVTARTPVLSLYEANVGYYQSRRLEGKELWLYNCIIPMGTYLNRFIKSHLTKTRLTPLAAWKTDSIGYLHWGWNYWWETVGPNQPDTFDTFNGAQNGDNFIVRPNKPALDVYDSIRSETQLDGIEDYELFTQLAKTKPVLARALANSLLTNTYAMDRSGEAIDTVHRQVLTALTAGGPDQAYPYRDDFAAGANSWQTATGSWSTTGGVLNQTDNTRWDFVAGLEGRAYADVAASVDLRITGVNSNGGAANWAGVVLRNLNGSDLDSGYLVAQRNNGEVFVYRSGKTLAKAPMPGYVPGQFNRLRVAARGSKITVHGESGSAPLLTVTDDAYQAGGFSLASGGVSVQFDNVQLNPEVNPAEARAVTTSTAHSGDGWSPGAVVDGLRASVPGANGWSSGPAASATDAQSVQVDLGSARTISRVDLYPRSDGTNAGSGFPVDFAVEVSADGSTWSTVATRQNQPNPGAAAQTFPFGAREVRYVKVTGTRLGQDNHGTYRMQFAELEVAGGNVAAGRAVTSTSSSEFTAEGWLRSNLTDGAHQSRLWNSMGWTSASVPAGSPQSVRVDLGGPTLISRLDLYARSDGHATGSGFPVDYVIETSLDGTTFTELRTVTAQDQPGAEPVTFTFSPTTARYVQIRGTELRPDTEGGHRMQFAELEIR